MESKPTFESDEFARLYAANQQALYRYILLLLLDPHDAHDVLQETSVALWRKHREYDPGRPFIAWAKRFAYMEVLQYRKRRKRRPAVFDVDVLEQMSLEAGKIVIDSDRRADALRICLGRVSDRNREVLRLRYEEDLSVDEIGGRVNRSRVAIYRQLTRLRKFLHECIQDRLVGEDVVAKR